MLLFYGDWTSIGALSQTINWWPSPHCQCHSHSINVALGNPAAVTLVVVKTRWHTIFQKALAQLYNMTCLKLYYYWEDSDQITGDNPPKQALPNSQSNPPKQAPPNSQSNPPKQAPPNSQSNPPKQAPPNSQSNPSKQAPPNSQSNPLKQACQCRRRCNVKKSCPCRKENRLCTFVCHPGHLCTNCEEDTSDVIDLLTSSPTTEFQPVSKWWIEVGGINKWRW